MTRSFSPHKREPMVDTNDQLVRDMMMHDAERMSHPDAVVNGLVYDSHDCPGSNSQPWRTFKPEAWPFKNMKMKRDLLEQHPGEMLMGFVNKTLQPWYVPENDSDRTLVFESRFESGNLRRAIQVYNTEYDLILRPDINTRGHTQWFFFSISNTRKNVHYKINIINMQKDESLYHIGMQPIIYSEKAAAAEGRHWHRSGHNVCYYQNNIKRKNGKFYYTLTMTFEAKHDNDTIYVAHCYPYTYSELQKYIYGLETDPKRSIRVKREILCKTLAGNNCDLLTVTNFNLHPQILDSRKHIVITGRVHPGESNASWMMRGALEFLTGDSLEAKLLRDNFVFKIVPMLNPDGVINGNYRCSLAGVDLNRVWHYPSKKLHPTIFYTKEMIGRLQEDHKVLLMGGFHGHSRKCNVFMYGCERKATDNSNFKISGIPGFGVTDTMNFRIQEKIFPWLLKRNAPDAFSFAMSSFKVQKSKENTARVVCWREFGLINSFTLEASFGGPSEGANAWDHFGVKDFEGMGAKFVETILDFCNPDTTLIREVCLTLEEQYPVSKHSAALAMKMAAMNGGGTDSDDSGTDSDLDSGDEDKQQEGKKAAARKPQAKKKPRKRRASLVERQSQAK